MACGDREKGFRFIETRFLTVAPRIRAGVVSDGLCVRSETMVESGHGQAKAPVLLRIGAATERSETHGTEHLGRRKRLPHLPRDRGHSFSYWRILISD